MRTIAEIEADIACVNADLAAMKPLLQKRENLQRELDRAKSRLFVEVNGVTRDEIHLSTDDEARKCLTFPKFLEWTKAQQFKRFIEWNGYVTFTADCTLSGRFDYSKACRLDDVPQEVAS